MKFLFVTVCCLAALYFIFFIVPVNYEKEKARNSQLTVRPTVQQVTTAHKTTSLAALWTAIKQEQRQEDYAQVRNDIALLISRYPESEQARAMAHLSNRYDSLARLAQQREAVKEQRRHQPGYYDHYPMESYRYWAIKHRKDEFNDTLPNIYLTTTRFLYFYGNAITYGFNSPLRARIEVDSSQAIGFRLFKKTSSYHINEGGKSTYQEDELFPAQTAHTVAVRSDAGHTYRLTALASQNRLLLNPVDSYKLHQLLQQGGLIRFIFTQSSNESVRYEFNISNADDYEDYCHELMARTGQRKLLASAR